MRWENSSIPLWWIAFCLVLTVVFKVFECIALGAAILSLVVPEMWTDAAHVWKYIIMYGYSTIFLVMLALIIKGVRRWKRS